MDEATQHRVNQLDQAYQRLEGASKSLLPSNHYHQALLHLHMWARLVEGQLATQVGSQPTQVGIQPSSQLPGDQMVADLSPAVLFSAFAARLDALADEYRTRALVAEGSTSKAQE